MKRVFKINHQIVKLDSEEVKWLFGIDQTILENWIDTGILSPEVTPEGGNLFWREDVTKLLVDIGA